MGRDSRGWRARWRRWARHHRALSFRGALGRVALVVAAASFALPAGGADLRLVGVFTGKALVSIDGAAPRTLAVGRKSVDGVTLVAVDGQQALFDVNGTRRTVAIGQGFSSAPPENGNARIVLTADAQGHFWAEGSVNGGAMRFLVDTGATLIALPAADARRIGLDYVVAPRGMVQTANGAAIAYFVKLDRVKLGEITLTNVDALVQENGLSTPLLGMSFLNRTEMRRDGVMMTLVRRY